MSRSQQKMLWVFNGKDDNVLRIENTVFNMWRTPGDGSCLFHALVLVLSHWPKLKAPQYQSAKTLRAFICKNMALWNRNDDPWFLKIMELFTDAKDKKSCRAYINAMKSSTTWGTRVEIIVFCHLYDCEIKIAHSSEGGNFKFDSTREAMELTTETPPVIRVRCVVVKLYFNT